MSFFVLIILCLVQGLCEFLPISSSGHLLLFEQLFNLKDNLLLINLFLHLSTLIAVIVVYRKTLLKLIKKPLQPLTFKLILSTFITVIFALAYEVLNIESIITCFYGFCFLVTSILLFLTHKFEKRAAIINTNSQIKLSNAILVGIVQGIAVLPGISRSGSTICTLMLCGESKETASEYSFLLSIPIIIGGFIFELLKLDNISFALKTLNPAYAIFAFVFTFAIAFLSLKLTLKLLKGNKFNLFAIYLLFISIFVIIYNFI